MQLSAASILSNLRRARKSAAPGPSGWTSEFCRLALDDEATSALRQAMLQALRDTPGANGCLRFVRQFYANPSQFVWHDARGNAHVIHLAEGGEHGDPLMPALFALGQHAALAAVQRQLRPGEMLLACLDDIYVIVTPERLLSLHLGQHARVQLHRGKTRVWNAPGVERGLGSSRASVRCLASSFVLCVASLQPQSSHVATRGFCWICHRA